MHPHVEYPLCVINESISAVAARVGALEQIWIEPGLGQARGFSVHQPTGLTIRAEELLERPTECPPGFTVYVEAKRLASTERGTLLQAVLNLLRCEHSAVTWIQTQ